MDPKIGIMEYYFYVVITGYISKFFDYNQP